MNRTAVIPLNRSVSPAGQLTDAFIQLINLKKTYSEGGERRVILEGVNLTISKGETLAVVGKSGSGKTTLLNVLSGIDRLDEGEIVIGDVCLNDLNEHQRTMFRREKIGFVFQFFNLIPTLTVWQNVILPLDLNHQADRVGLERAEALLDEVGLLSRKNAYPDRLSGGEQQRVAIARALVHDPLLVLADEPTGNLDEVNSAKLLDLIDRLTRRMNKNLIMVTHSREAAAIADRVMDLRDGKLEERHAQIAAD
ncbi:ABC transporter ATP-binding protein [Bellilinea sp.]|uniref:ABC transporter ATP-binding protein n=1 Tax=Bellilinea sp. TaxID=2838785 RepID=UPI002ADD7A83|nr:ABC transporter ATP-binding protein [Bellilinea sp.]